MKVTLVASTTFHTPRVAGQTPYLPQLTDVPDADELAEFAGRSCYLSWARPNVDTADNEDYLRNIIERRHFSVLEHASASFYIEDVSRSLTHELVRHRHFSFSQLSQRFVDSSEADFVVPPALRDKTIPTRGFTRDAEGYLEDVFLDLIEVYELLVRNLINAGMGRKQAREAARCVLPNMTTTSILVTGNMRTWREFIEKRDSPHADAEIRELATELLYHLFELAPGSFGDLYVSHS